jgi:hypothetical protein
LGALDSGGGEVAFHLGLADALLLGDRAQALAAAPPDGHSGDAAGSPRLRTFVPAVVVGLRHELPRVRAGRQVLVGRRDAGQLRRGLAVPAVEDLPLVKDDGLVRVVAVGPHPLDQRAEVLVRQRRVVIGQGVGFVLDHGAYSQMVNGRVVFSGGQHRSGA